MQQSSIEALLTNLPTISLFNVIINVFIAFLLGLFISTIYRKTYKGFAYSMTFVNTLIIITMVTSIVIMVIGNNLARAFGLVGAMSIIRFRTAVKDTRDIAFVFFALAAGMAAGAGNLLIGLFGCLIIGVIIILLHIFHYGTVQQEELLLRFWVIPESGDQPVYIPIFKKYLTDHTLLNVRSARLGHYLELSFNVRLKTKKGHQKFIQDLSALEGIDRVTLIVGESTLDM